MLVFVKLFSIILKIIYAVIYISEICDMIKNDLFITGPVSIIRMENKKENDVVYLLSDIHSSGNMCIQGKLLYFNEFIIDIVRKNRNINYNFFVENSSAYFSGEINSFLDDIAKKINNYNGDNLKLFNVDIRPHLCNIINFWSYNGVYCNYGNMKDKLNDFIHSKSFRKEKYEILISGVENILSTWNKVKNYIKTNNDKYIKTLRENKILFDRLIKMYDFTIDYLKNIEVSIKKLKKYIDFNVEYELMVYETGLYEYVLKDKKYEEIYLEILKKVKEKYLDRHLFFGYHKKINIFNIKLITDSYLMDVYTLNSYNKIKEKEKNKKNINFIYAGGSHINNYMTYFIENNYVFTNIGNINGKHFKISDLNKKIKNIKFLDISNYNKHKLQYDLLVRLNRMHGMYDVAVGHNLDFVFKFCVNLKGFPEDLS